MPQKTVYFVTTNENKLKEARKILGDDFPYKLDSVNCDVPEYQGSEEFIIKKKCEDAFELLKKPVCVDDTSLQIECLGNLPGPYNKYFLDCLGPDGLIKLITAWDNKNCRIICLVGFIDNDKSKCEIFKGYIEGKLVSPRLGGNNGFGWDFDSCFQPNGYDQTLSELSESIKNEISHRALAFKNFKNYCIKLESN